MSATECISREMLGNALPYQVVVNLSDGDEGTLRRLFCTNLNIGPGHETAVVHAWNGRTRSALAEQGCGQPPRLPIE